MDYQPVNLRDFFDAQVPRTVQQALLQRVILPGYQDALVECTERYLPEEAHDLLPYVRRAKIEQNVRALSQRHDGITAVAELNSTRNAYHTRITSSRVTFTISAVETPDTIAREARFRQTLARTYQLRMEGIRPSLPAPANSNLLYALIIHYPVNHYSRFPAFVHAVFPSPDCSEYVDRVDLLARFRDLPDFQQAAGPEPQPGEPNIRLRPQSEEASNA